MKVDWLVGAWGLVAGNLQGGGRVDVELISQADLEQYEGDLIVQRTVGQFNIVKDVQNPAVQFMDDHVHCRLRTVQDDVAGGALLTPSDIEDLVTAEEQFMWHRVIRMELGDTAGLLCNECDPAWGSIDCRVKRKLEGLDRLVLTFEPHSQSPTDSWSVACWIRVLVGIT